MTSFTASVAILCCALLTAALIKLLAPIGNTEKTLKMVIGIFVIVCLLSSVKGIFTVVKENRDFDKLSETSDDKTITVYNEKILSTTAQYMADYTRILLSNNEIIPKNVKVKVEADENMVINLSSISIYIDKDDTHLKDRIIGIVQNELKFTPEIIIEEN